MDIRWTFEHSDLLTFWFRWPGVKVRVAQDAGTYIWACSVSHIPAKALCCGHWPKPAVQSTPTGIWRAVRAPAGKMETIEWPSGISCQMSLFFIQKCGLLYSNIYTRMFRYGRNVYILVHLWHVQVTHRVYRPCVMMEKLCCLCQWSDGQRSGHTLWDSHLAGGYKDRSQTRERGEQLMVAISDIILHYML